MAYYKKYRCSFVNTDNQPCELSIWQEFASQPTIIDVTCSLDTIELINEEINISDSFISSQRLDFELISDYNWKYHDLYSVNMFYSRVELRVNNSLIYVGWIDSESYEEPFDYEKNYPVVVKSGNLKLLKRLEFNVSSIRTVREVITSCIQRVLPSANIAVSVDTYAWKDGMKYSIDKLQINPYVFFSNNDFKLPKCWEVLEEMCKAFQLRIIVSGNNVYVRDLVTWKGDVTQHIELLNGSDLSFDETYNKIHITLDLSTEKPIKDFKVDDSLVAGVTGTRYSIYQGAIDAPLSDTAFFYRRKQIASDTQIEGILIKGHSQAYIGKINSYYEGDNATFIVNNTIERIGVSNRVVAEFQPIPLFLSDTDDWFLNIKLDTMLSVLTDPFGNANRSSDGGNWWRNHENDFLYDSTLVYVPLNVYLKDDDGNILYYLDNTNNPADDHWNKGTWKTGTPPKGAYRLAYYSSNFQNHTAFSDGKFQPKNISGDKCSETNKAWATNSQYMTYKLAEHKGKPKLITDMNGKGSITTLPPVNGNLHIELLSGVDCVMYNDHYGTSNNGKILQKYEDIQWLCYKDLGVSITDSNGKEYYSDDKLEYEVNLNSNAEKELSYSTKIGCVIDGDKSAKAGVMINGEFVTDFTYKMDLSGDHLWYLEEHMMRVLEPILLKKRYSLNVTSKRIDMTSAVNMTIKGDSKQMIPTQMTYYPERNKCKTKLIEI